MSITIGNFTITIMGNGAFWINRIYGPNEGEGMEIKMSLLNEMFEKLFQEHM